MTDGPRIGDVVVYGTDDKNRDGIRQAGEIGHTGILSFVPGGIVTSAGAAIVAEARKWVGKGKWGLGRGGRNPKDGTPFDSKGRCDCSGFVCHCLRIDRFENGIWWNTNSIRRDGEIVGGRWEPVPFNDVDLRKCSAIHSRNGIPAVVETLARPWWRRGTIVRLIG